jgi:hypothetical protein
VPPPTPSVSPTAVDAASSITPAVVVSVCALVVSALALAFTILAFWWLNARRGKLSAYRPHSFAADLRPDQLLFNLPLVFHNGGAAPIVVQDLRLRVDKSDEQRQREVGPPDQPAAPALRMWWRATRPAVQPEPGTRPMPATFPVEGRKAVQMFIEFGLRQPAYVPRSGPYRAIVEAKLGHRTDWVDLLTFDLHTEQVKEDTAPYIAYSNDPQWEA